MRRLECKQRAMLPTGEGAEHLAPNPLRACQQPCLKPRMKRKGRPVTRRPEDSPGKMVTRDPRARKPSAQFQGLSHHTLLPMQGEQGCLMPGATCSDRDRRVVGGQSDRGA